MNPYVLAGYWSGAFFHAAATVLATVYHGPAAGMLASLSLAALSLYAHVKMRTAGGEE